MTINTSCEKCGGATRLVGIEPHPRLADTDVWTFECAQLRRQSRSRRIRSAPPA